MTSTTLMKTLGSCRRQRGGVREFEDSLQSNLTLPIVTTEEMDAQGGACVITLTLLVSLLGRKAETQRSPSTNKNHSGYLQTQASWLQPELCYVTVQLPGQLEAVLQRIEYNLPRSTQGGALHTHQ